MLSLRRSLSLSLPGKKLLRSQFFHQWLFSYTALSYFLSTLFFFFKDFPLPLLLLLISPLAFPP